MANLTNSGSFGRPILTNSVSLGRKFQSPRVAGHKKNWVVSCNFKVAIRICLVIVACLIVTGGYVFCVPILERAQSFRDAIMDEFQHVEECDMLKGKWVIDSSYPLYNSSLCPFAESGFNCQGNRRGNDDYLKWRWKPQRCHVPRFDANVVLQRLQGSRIVFVGDSMGRTQWESMICLLMTGVSDKGSVYEVNGNNITKQIRYLGVKFSSFNFTVEFFRSPFLVRRGIPPKHAPKRVLSTLKLDKLDEISRRWINSDLLIFNSGHWWNAVKLFDIGCYFQVGKSVKLGMPITSAYRMALDTWASWIESKINTNRTTVFFRTFEPSHRSDFPQQSCELTQQPMLEGGEFAHNPFASIVSDVVSEMRAPVVVLNITSMSASRSDAHIGNWSDVPSVEDCSHWCLPGVPDAWNEILLSYLLKKKKMVSLS